jgi:hypothetical protein
MESGARMPSAVNPFSGDPKEGMKVIADLVAVSAKAQEAEHNYAMMKGLSEKNQALQEVLHKLGNLLGSYIELHGPLEVDLRSDREDTHFELFTEPVSDKLGMILINANRLPGKAKTTIKPGDPILLQVKSFK